MRALSNIDIVNYLKKHNIPFNGIYSKNEIPNDVKIGWYILNMEDSGGFGTHWIAIYKDKNDNNNIYWDSFGLPAPLSVIDALQDDFLYQDNDIQSINSSSCGEFCLILLKYFKDKKVNEDNFIKFCNIFNNKPIENEKILSNLY